MHEIDLVSLDGGNLLGYLAALGTLRTLTLTEASAEIRMSWREKGWWTPVVHHSRIRTEEEITTALASRVCPPYSNHGIGDKQQGGSADWLARALANCNQAYRYDHLDKSLIDFQKELGRASGKLRQREEADFFAALGSDCFAENKDGRPATTDFRAIGAGNNEGFLGFMRTIHLGTTSADLTNALFREWEYSDPPPFMRWDHNEYRPHALRATDPAKDRKKNNVRGANRLAIEALPLFPTVPQARRLATVGFHDRGGKAEITWPIWKESLDLKTVMSLLASAEIQQADQPGMRSTMVRRGICQVFRAKRFTEGKYRNFSPARTLI
jgi:hypothetical protein